MAAAAGHFDCVVAAGRGDAVSALGAKAYFAGRAGHAATYLAGIPVLRTLLHFVGVAGTLLVASRLLG